MDWEVGIVGVRGMGRMARGKACLLCCYAMSFIHTCSSRCHLDSQPLGLPLGFFSATSISTSISTPSPPSARSRLGLSKPFRRSTEHLDFPTITHLDAQRSHFNPQKRRRQS